MPGSLTATVGAKLQKVLWLEREARWEVTVVIQPFGASLVGLASAASVRNYS